MQLEGFVIARFDVFAWLASNSCCSQGCATPNMGVNGTELWGICWKDYLEMNSSPHTKAFGSTPTLRAVSGVVTLRRWEWTVSNCEHCEHVAKLNGEQQVPEIPRRRGPESNYHVDSTGTRAQLKLKAFSGLNRTTSRWGKAREPLKHCGSEKILTPCCDRRKSEIKRANRRSKSMYVTTSVSGNFHSLMPFACIYHKSIGFRVKFNHCLPYMFHKFEVEELIKTIVNQNNC